ncbi:ATPase, T2SS/T4P/T4SS family [Acidithiobacillus sulfurivorans]|jgi:pilus assembly protein CpaF|uniref:Flp pilus assembly complex ATPase component TadA n=2 Tax=Acidithiobacillus TaxID=119977 RepID=A0ABS6A2I0_9PROT|nr:ATPase, T2SS/T4P/T4SS family [Acidithiobacillus sulfurivorans]MBU2761722.1 Flp pilus assembly complex ATPase component TadA [Acidithiobacillus sulfurivorans]
MFRIWLSGGRADVEEFPCTNDEARLGKAEDNLVVLQGWTIAAHHAIIQREHDGLYIKALESRSAVQVNGQRIQKPYGPLTPEDEIQIGGYRLLVRDDTPFSAVSAQAPATPSVAPPPLLPDPAPVDFALLRLLHERLISRMDFRRIDTTQMPEEELRTRTRTLLGEIITDDAQLRGREDRELLVEAALNEVVGLGPLESLLADDGVTEIMVNRYDEIFVERAGKLVSAPIVFSSPEAVSSVIDRIVAPLGRRIDESSPMVDGRLKDGSRVNAVIPPVALKGPSLTIRKFSKKRLEDDDLLRFGSANPHMLAFLRMAVEQRKNILISGGTGSGKTTLLNILSNHIPSAERIVTIEDAAELRLYQSNLVSMEARPANAEGQGQISIRELVRNSLRMRPDRIVVGECRGGEALDMLQAMNTGHDGSLTTVHANSPRDALSRLEVMVLMAGMDLPVLAIRQQVASAIDLIVQQSRFADGTRKITHISEVTGMENGVIQLQDLYLFRNQGFDAEGNVRGRFGATGRIPEFYEELIARGVDVDRGIFLDEAVTEL